MKRLKLKIAILGLISNVLIIGERVFAADNQCGGVPTILLNCTESDGEGAINHVVCLVVSIMVTGIGILAVLGLIVSGIQYLTSQDNEEKLRKAKNRIFQLVIGLVIYALLTPIVYFLMPGGLFTCVGGEPKSDPSYKPADTSYPSPDRDSSRSEDGDPPEDSVNHDN